MRGVMVGVERREQQQDQDEQRQEVGRRQRHRQCRK